MSHYPRSMATHPRVLEKQAELTRLLRDAVERCVPQMNETKERIAYELLIKEGKSMSYTHEELEAAINEAAQLLREFKKKYNNCWLLAVEQATDRVFNDVSQQA